MSDYQIIGILVVSLFCVVYLALGWRSLGSVLRGTGIISCVFVAMVAICWPPAGVVIGVIFGLIAAAYTTPWVLEQYRRHREDKLQMDLYSARGGPMISTDSGAGKQPWLCSFENYAEACEICTALNASGYKLYIRRSFWDGHKADLVHDGPLNGDEWRILHAAIDDLHERLQTLPDIDPHWPEFVGDDLARLTGYRRPGPRIAVHRRTW